MSKRRKRKAKRRAPARRRRTSKRNPNLQARRSRAIGPGVRVTFLPLNHEWAVIAHGQIEGLYRSEGDAASAARGHLRAHNPSKGRRASKGSRRKAGRAIRREARKMRCSTKKSARARRRCLRKAVAIGLRQAGIPWRGRYALVTGSGRVVRASDTRAALRRYARKHKGARRCEVLDSHREGYGWPRYAGPERKKNEGGERGPRWGSAKETIRVESIVYSTVKPGDSGRTEYEHDFAGKRPRLISRRGQLRLEGGSYKVTPRGIVG